MAQSQKPIREPKTPAGAVGAPPTLLFVFVLGGSPAPPAVRVRAEGRGGAARLLRLRWCWALALAGRSVLLLLGGVVLEGWSSRVIELPGLLWASDAGRCRQGGRAAVHSQRGD